MLAFAIYITHGLACYVAIDITWTDYLVKRFGSSSKKLFYEYAVRTMLVLVTCKCGNSIENYFLENYTLLFIVLLAVAIPNLELFISLFGALCLSALGLVFPALIQLFTYWKQISGLTKVLMILKNAVIVIIGLIGLFVGTYTSLSEIIATFFED